jgi:hypothetical protein
MENDISIAVGPSADDLTKADGALDAIESLGARRRNTGALRKVFGVFDKTRSGADGVQPTAVERPQVPRPKSSLLMPKI